ncbi:MAG: flagellar export chaperone FliS [Spirochaetales bacterium]|nr:flagellar export chaperone FliS [Spirochaetales bacterium]
MKADPLSAYRQTRVKTASQGQLIVMLYDEGIRQLRFASEQLRSEHPKLDDVHNAIVKAQDIVTELMASLDFDQGGDIAENLFHLYMFFNQQLVDANMNKDAKGLEEVESLMSELREAWATIGNQTMPKQPLPSAGINIAG